MVSWQSDQGFQFAHQIGLGKPLDRKANLLPAILGEAHQLADVAIEGDLKSLVSEILAYTIAMGSQGELSL